MVIGGWLLIAAVTTAILRRSNRRQRGHTLLPLDDCLYALQPTLPHLTRSSLHRFLQRHGISRLPDTNGDKPQPSKFKRYPIGFFHIDIAEVRTEQGKLHLFVAIGCHQTGLENETDIIIEASPRSN
jgi:hypothetical protein